MLSRLGNIVGRLRDRDLRWSPGDRVAFDTAPSQPLARRRTILEPSRVSAVNESPTHPVEMKNLTFYTGPSQPLARGRMLLGPSHASAVKESLKHPVETNLMIPALCLSRQCSAVQSLVLASEYAFVTIKDKVGRCVSLFFRFGSFGE
jgi:hypothetical protein